MVTDLSEDKAKYVLFSRLHKILCNHFTMHADILYLSLYKCECDYTLKPDFKVNLAFGPHLVLLPLSN